MLNGLDLFSGIGGITLALSPWVRPVAYCENDRYVQAVLLSRMREGKLPIAPVWDDVRTLNGSELNPFPRVDIIYGGFPCQNLSVAGNGEGLGGQRSKLFFEICRLAGDIRPSFIFLENVPAITVRGLDRVLMEFTALGYDTRWTTISAGSLGAPHRRDRWFLLAYSERNAGRIQPGWRRGQNRKEAPHYMDFFRWDSEPGIRRVDDGTANRLDRIKCLGNAVVPLQAREAFKKLIGIKGSEVVNGNG